MVLAWGRGDWPRNIWNQVHSVGNHILVQGRRREWESAGPDEIGENFPWAMDNKFLNRGRIAVYNIFLFRKNIFYIMYYTWHINQPREFINFTRRGSFYQP